MNLNTVPTKGNLMSAKSSLALARQEKSCRTDDRYHIRPDGLLHPGPF